MDKPRIAILTRPIDENMHSGSGRHWYEIARRLLSLGGEFHFTFAHYRRSDNAVYRELRSVGGDELLLPRDPVRASRALAARNFDVVHYYLPTLFSPIYGVRARKVVTLHGAEPVLLPRYYRAVHVLHDRYVVPAVTRAMDHIACVSETTREYARRNYPLRPSQRFSTIYNGVDPAFTPEAGLGRAEMDEEPYFFHVSKYSLRKNPWTMLAAFTLFLRRRGAAGDRRAWRLVIGGSGWENFRVRGFLKRAGIEERVSLLGYVERSELPGLYASAYAFLFPSLCEGFGMPNVEAMACGCPVITSDAFAIPEIVGDAARMISPPRNVSALVEEMNLLASQRDIRDELSVRGIARAQRYRWEDSALELLRVYRNLADQHRSERTIRIGPWVHSIKRDGSRAVGA
ncbi:MAG: glycosyltransferase family 4 protein [Spirochaetaceae bacterium]